jgi:hypothetical protein
MKISTYRAVCASLLLLVTVAWGQVGAAPVHASMPAGAARTPRERAHDERIARIRNRVPGSVDVYVYVGVSMIVGPLETDGFSIDAADGALWRGDSGELLRMCNGSDDYYCFKGRGLSFAVPKGPISDKQSWSRFDREYVVIAHGPMRLLGRSIDVHVIESVDDLDRKFWYYFSDEFGLVAVAFSNPERTTTKTFYSKELYGYPRRAPAATDASTID